MLARTLKITAMAVRQHLYRFRTEGLIDFSDERRPVGRPARLWRLTERAAARFPDSHASLTLEMIAAIRATFGEPGLDRLLRERTRVQKKQYCRPDSFRGRRARRSGASAGRDPPRAGLHG